MSHPLRGRRGGEHTRAAYQEREAAERSARKAAGIEKRRRTSQEDADRPTKDRCDG